jgi:hypothetical protein
MHCYDKNYADLAVLPPYNTLWAQVIRRGNPPQLVTSGVRVEYEFPGNTYSAGKTDFWSHAQQLFGLAEPLPENIGLTGRGLTGEMDSNSGFFIAEGIPITEFSDSAPDVADYFQLAHLTVIEEQGGEVLAETTIVAPISSEMRCDRCHTEPDPNFRWNILMKHDEEEGTDLLNRRPVLCAECHPDPALGAAGQPGVSTLSAAMHGHHAEEAGEGEIQLDDCYACHPGPETECLRDVMSQNLEDPLWCTDCHGDLNALADASRAPWQDEPRCGDCHDPQYAENPETLYRFSSGHGGLYCESCHNSTHAILPSKESRDNLQARRLQGYASTIQECTICHLSDPGSGGPHE